MFNQIKKLTLALAVLTIFNSTFAMEHHTANHTATGIVINDPWIRSAPPNAPALGLFMQINNNSDKDIKLLSVNARGYKRIELHRTIMHSGMMKMVKQDFMPIPAQGTLHVKLGSWHVMLIGPKRVPRTGETVTISLKFDNGTTQVVKALVKKNGMMKNHLMH
ncbi:Copper metallochaperone, bacterial analog of Cox17 protein [hydrothermal vent metagenome]|uniref:Copper metallochaperone, bacterial analog of Cox17 protein n=1 Tax=hydrothermal vent metagenome TaxID=652676 RepID=A0A1W1E2B9_9ZZZZ